MKPDGHLPAVGFSFFTHTMKGPSKFFTALYSSKNSEKSVGLYKTLSKCFTKSVASKQQNLYKCIQQGSFKECTELFLFFSYYTKCFHVHTLCYTVQDHPKNFNQFSWKCWLGVAKPVPSMLIVLYLRFGILP